MTPEQEMGQRIVDTAEWAAVALIANNGAAEVRGDACPRQVSLTLRRLADDIDHRHADHRCTPPVGALGRTVWMSADGRVWRPAGRSIITQIVLYRPDDGGDPLPLSLLMELHGPITPIGGDGR